MRAEFAFVELGTIAHYRNDRKADVLHGALLLIARKSDRGAPMGTCTHAALEKRAHCADPGSIVDITAVLVHLPLRAVLPIETVAAVATHTEDPQVRSLSQGKVHGEGKVLEGDGLIAQGNPHGTEQT